MVKCSNKAIFFDRDGVINKPIVRNGRPYAPKLLKDFTIYSNVLNTMVNLKNKSYIIIVVTNQKDVGAGITSKNILDCMHKIMKNELPIDDIKVCTCTDNCECYKPKPGMLIESKNKWFLDLANSFIIGDSWRDIGAGINAGCKTILIDREYNKSMPYKPDYRVLNLKEAELKILDN